MKKINPYIYKNLPKAETGMNLRGPRNQLAKQETTTKNVGTWFKDAGKWLLNTLVSPIEGMTQTNFYDPDMAHSGWQQFDDVFEGTHKGVGDALGYVYGGPMHAAMKESGKGMMDTMGVEEDVAPMSVQYGGRLQKAQNSINLGGGNTANNNTNSFSFKYDNTDPRMVDFEDALQNWIETTYGNGDQGIQGQGTTTSPMLGALDPSNPLAKQGPQQPSNIPTNAGTYGDPTKGQGWSDAVMEAASDPGQATANMIAGFANAGKNPVVAPDTRVYGEITKNTDSHPGSLAQSMGDIITGVDPTEYAYTKKHEDNEMRMQNAKKTMRAVGNIGSPMGIPSQYGGRLYQMGGIVDNPYMKTAAIQERAKSQGGMENMAAKVGAAIQHAGGVVGESLSGLGAGGGEGGGFGGMMGGEGGGMGSFMNFGGGEGGGFMSMFGGGEGGSGGGFMDMFKGFGGGGAGGSFEHGGRLPKAQMGGGMMSPGLSMLQNLIGGGQGGGGMDMSSIKEYAQNISPEQWEAMQGMFKDGFTAEGLGNAIGGSAGEGIAGIVGGFMNKEYGGDIAEGEPTPKRKGKSPYIATYYYQDGTEVRPEDMPRKATAADIKRINEWLNNTKMIDTPYPPTDSTDNPYYNIMNEIDVLTDPHQRSYEDFRNQPFQYGGIPKAQRGKKVRSYVDSLEAHISGSELLEHFLNRYPEVELDTIQGPFENNTKGHFNDGTRENMKPTAKIVRKDRRDNDPNNTNLFDGNLVADLYDKPTNIPKGYKEEYLRSIYNQNGGRLEKTSNLPMDMEGFTDLEPGFNRSNTIEINSGNNHSDLNDPHTPLNVPVPSFDSQGNAMTENVQILAEKGEFARKDPETGAVTIFSKNLKTKDSSGKRTNYAKIAEKLGKKEDRLTEQAKNPFDDIADASIQRALSNVKNKFIRLEEEQKVAKEVKEEEDRMDLMQLAKNGGRITKKNTYRMGGKVKTLSEYQKELIGMDDQGQMPMAQDSLELDYTTIPEEPIKNKRDYIGLSSKQIAEVESLIDKGLSSEEAFRKVTRPAEFADRLSETDNLLEIAKNFENKKDIPMGGGYKVPVEASSIPEENLVEINRKRLNDPGRYNLEREEALDELESEEGNPYKKKRKTKAERQKERETRKKLRELKKQQLKGESPLQTIEKERGVTKRNQVNPSERAKQIAELSDVPIENKPLAGYTTEGSKEAKELIEAEFGPLDIKGGLPCSPCEDGSIPSRDASGNCLDCPPVGPPEEPPVEEEETGEQQQQQRRGGGSGTNAINDYIRNLRGINADVENRFEPYPNFFEDYGRESESITRNKLTDLPEWYMDRASQLASANVNSLENAIRNMGQSMGPSGYLAQMQAAKNKELAANQGYAAQAASQREKQLGELSALTAQNELYDRTGAEKSFDLTQQALDAIDAAKYDTEKNVLTARLAQEREANAARRNELLDAQMQWMYNNDRTQYDKDGNPVNPGPATKGYGGKIKRDMYEYGSRVKRERQMKSDKAIKEFRSFMRGFNKK